jgi:hypothetical protein
MPYCGMSICDWEQIGDNEDTTLNQQGDMIALRTTEGYVYRVYFNHAEDKAYYALEPSTPAHVKESICKIINALGYEPVEINEED